VRTGNDVLSATLVRSILQDTKAVFYVRIHPWEQAPKVSASSKINSEMLANYIKQQNMKVKGISAIILVSKAPEALSHFYEEILDLHFTEDSHGDLEQHFFVSVGDLRLVIHPTENYLNVNSNPGAIIFCFSVDSLDSLTKNLDRNDVGVLKRVGENFGERIEFKDPDGNLVCAVQLNH